MKNAVLWPFMLLIVLICGLFSAAHAAAHEKAVALDGRIHTLGDATSVPAQLNYQGYLSDASDSSAVTATLEMTFRLFDAQMGGSELWAETHPAVEVSEGLFQVLLGSVTSFPDDLFDGSTLWLETQVGPEVLAPRKPLVSVAYSQKTVNADHAETADWAAEAQHAVHADTAEYAQNSIAAVAESAAVADDAHHLQGQTPTDLDGRWVNEEDLDHLNASDGNPLNALSVDATGRVGIATTSPSHSLDVNGDVGATTYYGDGSHLTGIVGTPDADWTVSGDTIYNATASVGIGTAGPGAKLEVKYDNDSWTTPAIVINNANSDGQDLFDFQFAGTTKARLRVAATGGFHVGTVTSGDLNLRTNNNVRMHITNDGNVGIGTTSPGYPLHVYKYGAYSPAYAGYFNAVGHEFTGTAWAVYADASADDENAYGIYATAASTWGTAYAGYFADGNVVVASGNMGVGTSDPARKLHVNAVMRLQPTSAPSSPAEGDIYMDSATHKLMVYDGTAWRACW